MGSTTIGSRAPAPTVSSAVSSTVSSKPSAAFLRRSRELRGPSGERRACRPRLDGTKDPKRWRVEAAAAARGGQATEPSDTYYGILGVSPGASREEIKKAYYDTMKDYHPDISTDEDATEFCIFLNEVYETLSDPETRAAYDEIAGFDVEAVNPFLDTSYPRDQVFVDEFTCIGCRNCNNVCPSSFMMEDLYGRARVKKQGASSEEILQEAIDTCPVDCIHWVTAPQLALLETEMAKIERVSAFVLMMGGGGGVCVFKEARTSYEKRQAAIRAKKEADEIRDWMKDVGFQGVDWKETTDESDLKRKTTAAKAAASARRWRDYQRNQEDTETLALPSGN